METATKKKLEQVMEKPIAYDLQKQKKWKLKVYYTNTKIETSYHKTQKEAYKYYNELKTKSKQEGMKNVYQK